MRRTALTLLLLLPLLSYAKKEKTTVPKVVLGYVTSWSGTMPDPAYLTHINYAFGHVTDSFNGVRIDNPERLRAIAALRKTAPKLKILLSVGGWGSGRFSEMAGDDTFRRAFAADCARVVGEFGLDGIDIDWEYPTNPGPGISCSPDDTQNFTLLMRDIRAAIGDSKLLTLATAANGKYIDFRGIDPYVNFVNIMAYDMARPPYHHAGLYRSEHSGGITAHEAVEAHLAAGVPVAKLVLGIPFYGRGTEEIRNFSDYKNIEQLTQFEKRWDDTAKSPYLVNAEGALICSYDDPRSLAIKCRYILDRGLLGGMYWDDDGDNASRDLGRTLYNGLNPKR